MAVCAIIRGDHVRVEQLIGFLYGREHLQELIEANAILFFQLKCFKKDIIDGLSELLLHDVEFLQ